MSLLEIKGLRTGFPQKPLINNLSLKINEPAFIAVIGHNGCGKTTFFRSLVKQHPYEGEVYLNGMEVNSIPDLSSAGLITLLEQKNTVNFSIPVKDLVVMGRFRKKSFFQNYDAEDYKEVSNILTTLNLSHFAEEDYLKLSGGEQQLIWLAQVMIQDTQIILLDEPTQQLDVHNKKKVFSLMQNWVKEHQKTVLCITHDIGNLDDMEGYVLNLAVKDPFLQWISPETMDDNLTILERGMSASQLV